MYTNQRAVILQKFQFPGNLIDQFNRRCVQEKAISAIFHASGWHGAPGPIPRTVRLPAAICVRPLFSVR
jgi:hypothetical protein